MSRNLSRRLDQAAAAAENTPTIQSELRRWQPVIAKLLEGTGINAETFVAWIGNACRSVPDLYKVSPPDSVIAAVLRSAQLGLQPNTNSNECWILPYKNRQKDGTYAVQAQWQLGYQGVLKLAQRAAPGIKFSGRAVHRGDDFDIDFGADRPVKHRPAVMLGNEPGDAYYWYVLATWPDGAQTVHGLGREGVEYHRRFSKQPDGVMWTKSYDAAALKSVVLDMRRWLPASAQLAQAIDSDERVLAVDALVRGQEAPPEVPVEALGELTESTSDETIQVREVPEPVKVEK